jgi:S-adenosylmethionine:tRNA ribosyltransferase-isomerase
MTQWLNDYDYDFPSQAVAQQPLADRSASRMMIVEASGGTFRHDQFSSLPRLLSPGDLLVINNTSVMPCRFFARKNSGGKVEIFLLKKDGPGVWECWLKPARGLVEGTSLQLYSRGRNENFPCKITIVSLDPQKFLIRFASEAEETLALAEYGEMPLPPYIKRPLPIAADHHRYQTIFAKQAGAVAAPTAGLHFTQEIFQQLNAAGISVAEVTLHVGVGTFAPVKVEKIQDHVMHQEFFHVPEETLLAIEACRRRGGRVIAVGTTSLRALESWATLGQASGWTDLFIRPGYRPRVVGDLLTNFHQPRSTLLMLVSVWAGHDIILRSYREALDQGYRFFSYGDCMLIRRDPHGES